MKKENKFLHHELNIILNKAGYKYTAYSFYGDKLTIIATKEKMNIEVNT